MGKIPVNEVFGPTIQGEGMVVGRKTMFIRTHGCDYRCSWCDSSQTWDGTEKAKMLTPFEVMERLWELGTNIKEDRTVIKNFNHVTISGGNPALIGEPMGELISMLQENGIEVGLETQGSKWQDWFELINDLTISPKPPSSNMKTDWDKLDEIVSRLEMEEVNFSLKVVVFNDEDFEYAKKVHQRYEGIEFFVSVGNEDSQEEGDISKRLLNNLDWLWDKVLQDPEMNSVKPLPQLHTLVWQNKRGV